MARGAAFLALLLAILVSGCVEIRPEDIELRKELTDDAVPEAAPPVAATAANDTMSPFAFQLALLDDRPDPMSPRAPWSVRVLVTPDVAVPSDGVVRVTHRVDEAPWQRIETPVASGMTEPIAIALGGDDAPGEHRLEVRAEWAFGPTPEDLVTHEEALGLVVYDMALLELDAGKSWYDGQKTFRTALSVPYAPWVLESGLVVLERAAARAGFTVETRYYPELDSHYVLAINGTREEWGPLSVWSYSWMIFHDGEQATTPIDDTRLGPGDTLTLRYLKCRSDGGCTDQEV